jgi:uncharacterized protein (TIGR02231 family)
MLLRRFLLLCFLLFPVVASGADPVRVQAISHISAVTVYPDRAMTTRDATLALKSGSYVIAFEGLPVLIQDDSVRVTGKGSAPVTITGIKVKRSFLEEVPEKRAKELETEIASLNRKAAALDAKKEGLASQKGFIESIKVAWGDRISKELAVGKPTSAELNEALTFVGTGVTRIEEQVRDIDEEKQHLKDRVEALQRQREAVIGSRRKEAKTVEVGLEASQEGTLTLDLTSAIPQASWEPSYDARLSPDGKSVDLVFRAQVRQRTGEDWQNVRVSLSTARPALGGAPPDLMPWRVSFYRAPVPVLAKAKAPAQEYAPAPAVQLKAAEAVSAASLNAEISEEQSSISFTVPRPMDIPSDGAQHDSFVATETIPVTLEFLAVPKLSPHVYLRSEVVNRAVYPLLPGRVNVFTGNNYTGSTRLKKVAAGEKFDLFFGTDDQVTIKREETRTHKEAGLFGRNRMEYRYRVEVQNFRKEPRTITIRDQMPVSGDEEIKVILDEPMPKPTETGADGALTWKLPVQPGEKQVLTFGILIEYPKDRAVSGLQ